MKFNTDDCGWIIEDDDLQAARVYPYEGFGDMRMPEDALVVLLAAEVVIPLSGNDGKTIGLYVFCNDTFVRAADAEPIPPIGFGEDMDQPFWDLWDRWVADRTWGPVQWIALRRGYRPLPQVVDSMKAAGAWTDEMESLPRFKQREDSDDS